MKNDLEERRAENKALQASFSENEAQLKENSKVRLVTEAYQFEVYSNMTSINQ